MPKERAKKIKRVAKKPVEAKKRVAAKKPVRKSAKKPAKKASVKKAKAAGKKKTAVKKGSTKSADFTKCTLRQIIARISEHLEEADYAPVLTSSACAAIYVGPSLKPSVIEFVIDEYNASELDSTMRAIGFKRVSMNHYESSKAPYDIVFDPPPLAVGDDVVKDIATASARPGKFKLLNPTDCVRQRLSMFYRWGDKDAFYEAVEVVKKHKIDMDLVRRWSEWEWCTDKYEEFVRQLEEEKKMFP